MRIPRWTASAAVGLIVLAATACAPESESGTTESAGDYPSRAIELVVPWDAGGATDIAARMLGENLSDSVGQPVNVVNKPGADQITGVQAVTNGASDGYTLLADGAGSSSQQALLDDLPFPWDERTFVARVLVGPHAYAVGSNFPADDLAGLVRRIKADPGSFKIAWLGGTSTSDFATLQLLVNAGIDPDDVKRVPFQSSGDAMTAAAGGDVDLAVGGASATFSLAQSGDLKVLAVTSEDRVKQLPDVPTSKEASMPELDIQYWVGISAPPDLPEDVTDALSETVTEVAADDDFAKKAQGIAMTPDVLTGEDLDAYVQDEASTFQTLANKLGDH